MGGTGWFPPVYLCRPANSACNNKSDAQGHGNGMKGGDGQSTPPAEHGAQTAGNKELVGVSLRTPTK